MKHKLRNIRPKALFGENLAAAGITAAATLAAANISKRATESAAAQQAAALDAQARTQADALIQQNENNNNLQQKMMDFTRAQNDEIRQIQRDTQMALQLQAGQQNSITRADASKIQVRNGGKPKRRLKNIGANALFLQGGNLPFMVTDGGGVVPLGQTPEGYDLYEIYGNDHEHRHKTRGRHKTKTGVGFKFANGGIVEGEGNQNTSRGERLLVTPDDAYFISKHSIKGFNPSKAIDAGIHPLEAYNTQELIKQLYGISDDGKKVEHGGHVFDWYGQTNPSYSFNDVNNAGLYVTTARRLKNGGKCRPKAIDGTWIGPIGTGAANILGAAISTIGTNKGSKILSDAYERYGATMADAYNSLREVDLSKLNRGDYTAAHYLPVIRTPYYNANPQLTAVNRSSDRTQRAIDESVGSNAARLARLSRNEVNRTDALNAVYADKANREEQMRRENANAQNRAAAQNAELDTRAAMAYADAYKDLLTYNNDIANQRILGAASAQAESNLNASQVLSSAKTSNASTWANSLTSTAQGFANALNNIYDRQNKLNMALLGADPENRAMYYSKYGTQEEAQAEYNYLVSMYNSATNANRKATLKARINTLAVARGFATVN